MGERMKIEKRERKKKVETEVFILGYLQGEFYKLPEILCKILHSCVFTCVCVHIHVRYILGVNIKPLVENHCSID